MISSRPVGLTPLMRDDDGRDDDEEELLLVLLLLWKKAPAPCWWKDPDEWNEAESCVLLLEGETEEACKDPLGRRGPII